MIICQISLLFKKLAPLTAYFIVNCESLISGYVFYTKVNSY